MKLDETNRSGSSAALDRALTAALEQRPEIAVPLNFAAQVMSRLPDGQPGKVSNDHNGSSVGRTVAYLSAAATSVALVALVGLNPAAFEAGKTVAFAVEMVLVAELLGVGLWLGMRRDA